jgi:hypothetical protein
MKRLFIALACIAAITGALADEPAKGKAKKAESGGRSKAESVARKIWITPSDRERLEKQRAAKARAKQKAQAK